MFAHVCTCVHMFAHVCTGLHMFAPVALVCAWKQLPLCSPTWWCACFRQTTQHDTSFKFTGVMERQDKSHTQMPRPDHAVTCTNNCSCRTIEFKACKVLRAETHHCPMWPPPREMHFATRCCIRGTSLAAPGYLRAILGRAVLNLWKLAKLFARSCSSTQAHTFS